MVGLAAGLCASGCALALVASTQAQLYQRNSVTLKGEVIPNGRTNLKIGLLRYFEGDDSSGSFELSTDPSGNLAFTAIAVPTTDASHSFTIVASSSHKIADFLLLCWSDTQGTGELTPSESRDPESYLIDKVGTSFSVARASADETIPLATPSLGTWPDAANVLFTFDFPPASGS